MLKWLIIGPVRFYQWCISPFFPSSCRHSPTCSEYMIQAVREWGILRGTALGIKRLSKCHPWGTSGYDPVPRPPRPSGTPPYQEGKPPNQTS